MSKMVLIVRLLTFERSLLPRYQGGDVGKYVIPRCCDEASETLKQMSMLLNIFTDFIW